MLKILRRPLSLLLLVVVGLLLTLMPPSAAQQSINVRIDRWLLVQAIAGEVQFFTPETRRAAQIGDRLIATGYGIRTGNNASCILEVDTGVGTITLQPNTQLEVRNLAFADDNGYITHLYVSQGSVNLNLRRFTHPGSELEIETPSGVSGVRGTEFGVIVHPDDQRTGVATRTGAVYASAQAVTVDVEAGYQTLIRPGEPPLEPTPIPPTPTFDYRVEPVVRNGLRYLRLVGQVDPINQAYVGAALQTLTATGEFQYEVPAYYGVSLQIRVVTPLGDEAVYDISLL
ncbi:MAG TPA: FecR domain-containing protein [Candidatus Obscuribacterales bacterium]